MLTDRVCVSLMMESQKRKRKGGAEKVRLKRKKIMEEDAAKCSKITDMFPGINK